MYLHSKLEHPNSTKKRIAYSHALRFSKFWYDRCSLHNNFKWLLNTLTRGVTIKKILQHKSTLLFTIPRNELLNKIKTCTDFLPFTVTYKKILPNWFYPIPQNNNWQKLVYFTNWTKLERNFCWTSNIGIRKKQKP